ncbi:hypothetical protein ACFQ72_17140 [Streptomyces celluloflavus]|uniref:hypothetical protein n=1 Tax=Streptomyces celluloflavus TaxID=58344 RepID=UPI0036C73B61
METFERAKLDAYFARIAVQFAPDEQTSSFLITHLLAERPTFVRAVAAMTRLTAVLPKPKFVHPAARRETERTVAVDTLTRELFTDPDTALDYFESRVGEVLVAAAHPGGLAGFPARDRIDDRVGDAEDQQESRRCVTLGARETDSVVVRGTAQSGS